MLNPVRVPAPLDRAARAAQQQAMDEAERELGEVMRRLASGHDTLPFMDRQLAAADACLVPLPPAMGRLLATSPDYVSPDPGEGPVWLQVEAPHGSAELVVYRARSDDELYVVAPAPQG